jgi:hypothetical protein
MTEAEWLACNDLAPMLKHLEGPLSERKLRLFMCACCRRVMGLIPGEHNRKVLAAAEGYADELKDYYAWRDLQAQCPEPEPVPFDWARIPGDQANWTMWSAQAAYHAFWAGALHVPSERHWLWKAVRGATQAAAHAVGHQERARAGAQFGSDSHGPVNANRLATEAERVAQCRLVRDIVGNPFSSVTVNLAWQTPTVVSLAQSIYADRTFDRMPILGDALEDAGCTNADILAHCSQPGEHVRGCWVVDLLLGKS